LQRNIIIDALPANMLKRASTSDHACYHNNVRYTTDIYYRRSSARM